MLLIIAKSRDKSLAMLRSIKRMRLETRPPRNFAAFSHTFCLQLFINFRSLVTVFKCFATFDCVQKDIQLSYVTFEEDSR
jgi:hypothetical protein